MIYIAILTLAISTGLVVNAIYNLYGMDEVDRNGDGE